MQQEHRQIQEHDAPHTEWEDLLQKDITPVLPDDYMDERDMINIPSEENPALQKVSDLAFRGYVEVWDRVTGALSLQPEYLLWQTMVKKRDGIQVFTRNNPNIPPVYGDDLKCVLHVSSPQYEKLMGMGFKECRKSHIPNRAALNSHISHSHKATWAYLEQDRIDQRRDEDLRLAAEDRELNRQMIREMQQAALRGVAAPDAPWGRDVAAPDITVPSRKELFSAACADCTKAFAGKSRKQAQQRLGLHQRQVHPDLDK